MSIIDKKYAERYKNREPDWAHKFIDDAVKVYGTKEVDVKDEEGKVTGKETVKLKKATLDLDKLFGLCKVNGIDYADMEKQRDQKNAPGRIRMTLGNTIRAEAKHRHGLMNLDGKFVDAPADFIGDAKKTKNPDGSTIEAPKTEAAADAGAEAKTGDEPAAETETKAAAGGRGRNKKAA